MCLSISLSKQRHSPATILGETIKGEPDCEDSTVKIAEKKIESDDEAEARRVELEKRRRKIEAKGPLTQKWYKSKQSNLSPNQKRILREHFPTYGIQLVYGETIKLDFCNKTAKLVLDIGFGLGDSLIGMAQSRPNDCFIGCELHKAGIAQALQRVVQGNLTNVRIIKADVSMLLEGGYMPDDSLDEICVFFPDPWVNAERDIQKRVIRETLLSLFERKLKQGAMLRIATDVQDYANYVQKLMEDRKGWSLISSTTHLPCQNGPIGRPITRYEERAISLGHTVTDFEYLFDN